MRDEEVETRASKNTLDAMDHIGCRKISCPGDSMVSVGSPPGGIVCRACRTAQSSFT
jgi:hypothetical protein